MSRLDRHVATVRNKLALDRFITALAWASLGFAALVWLAILLDKMIQWRLPRPDVWFWAGLGATLVGSIAYALWRRPSRHHAAVEIDQKLGLKERISTALYVRPSSDEFAAAAVKDAETTAERVVIDYRRLFPFRFPRQVLGTFLVAGLALWSTRMEPWDLFGKAEQQRREQQKQAQVEDARKAVESALATVEAIPRAVANDEAIRLAKSDLLNLRNQPIKDPEQAKRSAAKALQDVNEALKQKISGMQELADAKMAEKMFKQLQQPGGGEGPVADAHKAMVQGQFEQAVQQLEQALEKFDKMDEQEQQKAAEQMKQLAQAHQQMAHDQQLQQQMQKQLEQLGMNQQQAQQAQQLMQQAAQGDKQAQRQLQQMARQMMQQMNNGQGPSQKQQQQLQQMMNQLQGMANNQQVAQQMAQAAQQMAKAMQQQAQQQQQQRQGQQGQQGQQQQAQIGQQMNQGMQAMRQQLQQMQAVANDARQIQAAQGQCQAAQANAQDALNGAQGGGRDGGGQGQWGNNPIQGNGQQGQWNGQANFAGPNPGGIGAGDRNYKAPAPYTVKQEVSQSQEDEQGKVLASTFVKDNRPIRGDSRITLKDVAAAAQAEQTDEVDNERITPQAQRVVREYFGSMERESAPSTQPAK